MVNDRISERANFSPTATTAYIARCRISHENSNVPVGSTFEAGRKLYMGDRYLEVPDSWEDRHSEAHADDTVSTSVSTQAGEETLELSVVVNPYPCKSLRHSQPTVLLLSVPSKPTDSNTNSSWIAFSSHVNPKARHKSPTLRQHNPLLSHPLKNGAAYPFLLFRVPSQISSPPLQASSARNPEIHLPPTTIHLSPTQHRRTP